MTRVYADGVDWADHTSWWIRKDGEPLGDVHSSTEPKLTVTKHGDEIYIQVSVSKDGWVAKWANHPDIHMVSTPTEGDTKNPPPTDAKPERTGPTGANDSKTPALMLAALAPASVVDRGHATGKLSENGTLVQPRRKTPTAERRWCQYASHAPQPNAGVHWVTPEELASNNGHTTPAHEEKDAGPTAEGSKPAEPAASKVPLTRAPTTKTRRTHRRSASSSQEGRQPQRTRPTVRPRAAAPTRGRTTRPAITATCRHTWSTGQPAPTPKRRSPTSSTTPVKIRKATRATVTTAPAPMRRRANSDTSLPRPTRTTATTRTTQTTPRRTRSPPHTSPTCTTGTNRRTRQLARQQGPASAPRRSRVGKNTISRRWLGVLEPEQAVAVAQPPGTRITVWAIRPGLRVSGAVAALNGPCSYPSSPRQGRTQARSAAIGVILAARIAG